MNYKRKIYGQDKTCILNTEVTINSTLLGTSKIGLSGNINCLLTFESGNIYDFNGYNIYQYKKFDKIDLECAIGTDSYNIKINDNYIVKGITKPTGILNYIYVNDNNNQLTITNLQINGYKPEYITGKQNDSSFYIKNLDDYPIVVFSGNFIGNNIQLISGFTGELLNNQTGFYTLSGSGTYNYTYTLSTNFGETIIYGNS